MDDKNECDEQSSYCPVGENDNNGRRERDMAEHVLIVASAPMDYGTRKAASSATGFIDGVEYIGAAPTGVLSGWLTDAQGWDAAFYLWIAASIFAGVLMLLLWNYKPEEGGKYQ